MKTRKTTISRMSASLVMTGIMLAGCGGETEINNACDLINELNNASCTIGQSASEPAQQPPATTTPPADTSGGSTDGSGQVRVSHVTEWEPNNTLDNANPFSFPDKGTADAAAIDIDGSVQQDIDPADFFIFTPVESGLHLVYLCGQTCADRVETGEVYIMVYDQSQTTLESTPVGTESEQWLSVELTAGMAYYVEVNGYNTGGGVFPYRLAIVD